MMNNDLYKGFNNDFLIDDTVNEKVDFPKVRGRKTEDIAPVEDNLLSIVNYLNYSIQLSISRKFPFFTASNINGALFKKGKRSSSWKKDPRIKLYQWGSELYRAAKSHFDKGHMTKREDVQWGENSEQAQKAAESTFFYSNAVPQHKRLNQRIWKRLEDYILHKEVRKNSLKICVFTGPILNENDPQFVTLVKDQSIQIPCIFWKVVVFPKENGKLYRVGFMMSQRKLLVDNGVVYELESATSEDELLMSFDDAETYQVNIGLIEELAGMTMPKAIDSYQDNRSRKLVLTKIEIDPDHEFFSNEQPIDFYIDNLVL